jgi:hypothetical protein
MIASKDCVALGLLINIHFIAPTFLVTKFTTAPSGDASHSSHLHEVLGIYPSKRQIKSAMM